MANVVAFALRSISNYYCSWVFLLLPITAAIYRAWKFSGSLKLTGVHVRVLFECYVYPICLCLAFWIFWCWKIGNGDLRTKFVFLSSPLVSVYSACMIHSLYLLELHLEVDNEYLCTNFFRIESEQFTSPIICVNLKGHSTFKGFNSTTKYSTYLVKKKQTI